jgi:hypothetical protein
MTIPEIYTETSLQKKILGKL